ncbi:MAG: putative porin [Prevotella salivae]|uniref:putative porin n=1 Tax=Segatella salivae TaxID=228604 RepID=UPI001CAFEAD8|nr:putative porin [Segatella salivae]MBF1548856.1 putative porin [Segatella salivae]
MKAKILTLLFFIFPSISFAQFDDNYNQIDAEGNMSSRNKTNRKDTLKNEKEIPEGIKVWTIDSRFGDRKAAVPDTLSHMFMNTVFTTGLRGEYNTTGNLGAPRINRIFTDRQNEGQFIFTQPFDFFITPIGQFHFTNTLSPFTNITYNTAGNRLNGEDHLTTKFGVNAGKKLGVGFKFDYLYGRGYYLDQSTAHFNYTMYGSYIGDHYQAHLLLSTNHQKVTENGGITNDNYIIHPESYSDKYTTSEIPTVLSQNWNRNDNQHIFFTHRYNLGFSRKVPMTADEIKAKKFAMASKKENESSKQEKEPSRNNKKDEPIEGRPDNAKIMGTEPDGQKKINDRLALDKHTADSLLSIESKKQADSMWMKKEFVPVTSFIHTIQFDNYRRIYQAYNTPSNYYANNYNVQEYLSGDSIYDKTRYYSLKNTFALSLLEGFNKWAKAGLKAFITSDLRHFTLPNATGIDSYNEHNLSIGAQLSKTQGKLLHYDAIAETWLTGSDAGQMKLDVNADLNFKLFGDTLTLSANGFLYRLNPTFYYRHFHSRHAWWDNDNLSKIIHSRIQGILNYQKTRTTLRVEIDEIKNYTYFASSYNTVNDNRVNHAIVVKQNNGLIHLLTASISQDFTFGPINWENMITYQNSSNKTVLPVPALNIYSNLYLRFKIAHVLRCDFGADVRYFTKYYAPDYVPILGQYAIQTNTDTNGNDNRIEIGNYPVANVYANFHLKHTRFFIMISHFNAGTGRKNYFFTPHYPLNQSILRFGLSWNFFN